MVGDVDFAAVAGRARAVTPVPGGVGPVTDVWLMRNTMAAAAISAWPAGITLAALSVTASCS
jgi:methylenetetrahydrofolate dehydrogenase (NADP+)/methenyltetrahydrofolate cyclohydrolase